MKKISYSNFNTNTSWEIDFEKLGKKLNSKLNKEMLTYGASASLLLLMVAYVYTQPNAVTAFATNVQNVPGIKPCNLADHPLIVFLRDMHQRHIELEAIKTDAACNFVNTLLSIR